MYRVDILRTSADAIEAINTFKAILSDGAPEGVVPIDRGHEIVALLNLNDAAEAILAATTAAICLDAISQVGLLETAHELIGEVVDQSDDEAVVVLLEAVHGALEAVVDEIDG